MSFGFAAIGTVDEVIAQLGAAPLAPGEQRFNQLGADVRDLLVEHFKHEHTHARPAVGYEYRYVVKAGGHGGGGVALSLNVAVEYQHVAVPAEEATAQAPGGAA